MGVDDEAVVPVPCSGGPQPEDVEGFFAECSGPIKFEVGDLSVTSDGQLAFAHYVAHMTGAAKDGTKAEMTFR